MLDLHGPAIEAFVSASLKRFGAAFPSAPTAQRELLERACRESLETLLTTDCAYHDMHHTMLVADAGQVILRGRMLSEGDLRATDWLHAVIAMLYHDIGYLRGALRQDQEASYIADEMGNRVHVPPGATDAYLTPYHVTRGCLFIHERFGNDLDINVHTLASHIEMTRFPIPADAYYQDDDSLSALVRAADLIGQMGDPQYLRKLSRLFAEFQETGDAERLTYTSPGDLREKFPDFFYEQVYPYIGAALRYLSKTREGQQWMATLMHHVHGEEHQQGWMGPERGQRSSQMPEQPIIDIAKVSPLKRRT
ncbi:MAG: hypothetical protein AB8B93_14745 [Pseudomonadales bacterium]